MFFSGTFSSSTDLDAYRFCAAAGDVITLEPGLYRSGYGGCRLEDLVLVTQDGAEVLTDYPYDLEP